MAQVNGTAGNDTFTQPGDYTIGDELLGGAGDDTYNISAGDTTTTITELDGEGSDTVISESDFILSANVENLDLDGAATTGVGNAGANVIRGLDAGTNYELDGEAGNDVLIGNDGDDNIDGGLGADVMLGGAGDDTYYVDNMNDVVTDTLGSADKIFFAGNLGVVNLSAYANIESFEIDSPDFNPPPVSPVSTVRLATTSSPVTNTTTQSMATPVTIRWMAATARTCWMAAMVMT